MRNAFGEKLKNDILKSNVIVISAHFNADGDAVGSTLAMADFVEKLGKTPVVFVYFKGDKFNYILNKSRLFKGSLQSINPDLFIALDCGDKERLGEGASVFDRAKITYNIDHHISNIGFADNNFVRPKASSTCELVYELISPLCEIDKHMAECLYTGIITDTSAFKHSCTGRRTMEIGGELIEKGIDFTDIQARMLYRHDFAAAKAFGAAVVKAKLEDGVAYTFLTLKEIRAAGAIFEQLDGIAEYCLNINGAKASVFVYEKGENIAKCSFRSNGVDVNRVAAGFGGGGHICAAGCTIEGMKAEDAFNECVSRLKAAVRAYE